jgi:hypothetical protein
VPYLKLSSYPSINDLNVDLEAFFIIYGILCSWDHGCSRFESPSFISSKQSKKPFVYKVLALGRFLIDLWRNLNTISYIEIVLQPFILYSDVSALIVVGKILSL